LQPVLLSEVAGCCVGYATLRGRKLVTEFLEFR
jgi:hypothetical protein